MSASSEAYVTLKNNFATSHAVVSVSQYILGIGDRHLSNFMIDQENGRMVGIDFGHAFGSATQVSEPTDFCNNPLCPAIKDRFCSYQASQL